MITRRFLLPMFASISACCLPAQNYKIVNANSGLVLEVPYSTTTPGAILDQWQWNGGANQQWNLVPIGNGWSYIQNVGNGQLVSVYANSTDDGAQIDQWPEGAPSQQWQIVPQGSSWNSIANLNSGKVLDVTNFSQDDGALIQQWDWLVGANQQWQIVPVQDTYQSTGSTDMYYDPNSNGLWVTASWDVDYNTQYYYGGRIVTTVYHNGNWIQSGESADLNDPTAIAAFQSVQLYVSSPTAGDYYEAQSTFSGITEYQWSQVIQNCGPLCQSWYDPFNYDLVESNPQGTDIPTFNRTVWAAPIVLAVARFAKILTLGHNANALTIPGNPGVFDLKLRAFIPPAWVRGADTCLASDGTVRGTIYAGDNRSFDPFSNNYRAHSEVVVSASSGSETSTPIFLAGVTTRYASDALAPDGYTLIGDNVYSDCHLTDTVMLESNSSMYVSVSGSQGTVTTNFYGSAQDATTILGSNTPSTDWNVTFTISTSNPAFPAYTVNYTHDCYPAYEAYIGTQLVYGFKPSSNSRATIVACLAGAFQIQGSTIGTVN